MKKKKENIITIEKLISPFYNEQIINKQNKEIKQVWRIILTSYKGISIQQQLGLTDKEYYEILLKNGADCRIKISYYPKSFYYFSSEKKAKKAIKELEKYLIMELLIN